MPRPRHSCGKPQRWSISMAIPSCCTPCLAPTRTPTASPVHRGGEATGWGQALSGQLYRNALWGEDGMSWCHSCPDPQPAGPRSPWGSSVRGGWVVGWQGPPLRSCDGPGPGSPGSQKSSGSHPSRSQLWRSTHVSVARASHPPWFAPLGNGCGAGCTAQLEVGRDPLPAPGHPTVPPPLSPHPSSPYCPPAWCLRTGG